VLDYLGRYVFRIAISNTRIVGLDDQAVTIRHKHRKSNRWRTTRLPGHEFMRRFLRHVLPTRSATSACGTTPGASRPPEPASCCNSPAQRPGAKPRRSRSLLTRPQARRNPRSAGAANRPADLHPAPFPQAGLRAMTLGGLFSEQHRCPSLPLHRRRQNLAPCPAVSAPAPLPVPRSSRARPNRRSRWRPRATVPPAAGRACPGPQRSLRPRRVPPGSERLDAQTLAAN
jgi:hypothetical protein